MGEEIDYKTIYVENFVRSECSIIKPKKCPAIEDFEWNTSKINLSMSIQ